LPTECGSNGGSCVDCTQAGLTTCSASGICQ
jgi:hypothetical protein